MRKHSDRLLGLAAHRTHGRYGPPRGFRRHSDAGFPPQIDQSSARLIGRTRRSRSPGAAWPTGDASGVQQADITRSEAGDANPTLATIAALAYALGAELALEPSRPRKAEPRRRLRKRASGARRVPVRVAARRTS